ncbi:hypothetical protein [Catellatospora vulcania]|uniref:hypothetical protein n=1 Tax=Catellatospora vulcania TaxID=1460450 RepID=UPI0012D3D319|nr:hypothetical protein [Catellatospora vulcania]
MALPTPAPDAARRAADDIELTVALAEYTKILEMRRAVSDQAHNRYNFFLVIATAVAAVSAGLLGSNIDDNVKVGAVATLGTLVLLMGPAVFARQLRYTGASQRYGLAEQTLRTYLLRRAPDLVRFVLLPTLDDAGLFPPPASPRRRRLRDAVGLAATIGLVNSALFAMGGGLLAAAARLPGWAVIALALALFAAAAAGHFWWIGRTARTNAAENRKLLAARALANPSIPDIPDQLAPDQAP